MKIGILSDTHGRLDPRIHGLLRGVDEIIHAGDIGHEDILIELESIAPVTAVRGNMDRTGKIAVYRDWVSLSLNGLRVFVTHDLGSPLRIKRAVSAPIEACTPQVIVFGHTHTPYNHYHQHILYFNPGSASQDRSGKGRSLGILELKDSKIIARHLFIDP